MRISTVFTIFCFAASITAASCPGQALIAWSSGPPNARPTHNSPTYIANHIDFIESRPFDGMVINEYLGRNLFNPRIREEAPTFTDQSTGAITFEGARKSLAPIKGIFKKFNHNFVKVNSAMTGIPPLLTDENGWDIVIESARNYGRAVGDAGLRGIFFDNETYFFPQSGKAGSLDYWRFADQLVLGKLEEKSFPLMRMVTLARRRGREFMAALTSTFPTLVLIVAHGPYIGCSSANATIWSTGSDSYLAGAFSAGMVEGLGEKSKFVDGGEIYDYRNLQDFKTSRAWRKGGGLHPSDSISNLSVGSKCPFMDDNLAKLFAKNVSIAFGMFDKTRLSRKNNKWGADTDVTAFSQRLRHALENADDYVWHYTQWQDWWGTTTEEALAPFITAISAIKHDIQSSAGQ